MEERERRDRVLNFPLWTDKDDLLVMRWIGEKEVTHMKIDTGAAQTVVHLELVDGSCYTGESIHLISVGQQDMLSPLAKVWLHLRQFPLLHTVAVMDIAPDEALVGHDLGLKKNLSKQKKADQAWNTRVLATRRQADEEAKTREEDDWLSSESGAIPINLNRIYPFSDIFNHTG